MSDALIDGLDFELEEELEEERELTVVRFERTTVLPPGAGRANWEESRAAILAHRLAKGRNPDGSKRVEEIDDEDAEPPVEVLEEGHPWPLESLPTSPRGLMREVLADGWEAIAQRSLARHAEVLFKADSKPDAKTEHSLGEVRFPEKRIEHFGIQAMLGEAARFWATWERLDGKTKFVGALIWDVAGNHYFETKAGLFKEWRVLFKRPADRPAPKPEPGLSTEFTMEEAA